MLYLKYKLLCEQVRTASQILDSVDLMLGKINIDYGINDHAKNYIRRVFNPTQEAARDFENSARIFRNECMQLNEEFLKK